MTDDEIVNDLDSMPFDGLMDPRYERPILVQPRKCRRHDWDSGLCRRCGHIASLVSARRNRNNRKRGNRTSHELAVYLGGRNVEALKLPWDVEGLGYRLQSKRLADEPSLASVARYIRAIEAPADTLRGFYHVGARQRLASGTVWCLYPEWVAWHGWDFPAHAGLASWVGRDEGAVLIELPLPVFRDLHVGGAK